jgi:hypothetical protein
VSDTYSGIRRRVGGCQSGDVGFGRDVVLVASPRRVNMLTKHTLTRDATVTDSADSFHLDR